MKNGLWIVAIACLASFAAYAADSAGDAKKSTYVCDRKVTPPKCFKINSDGSRTPLPETKTEAAARDH